MFAYPIIATAGELLFFSILKIDYQLEYFVSHLPTLEQTTASVHTAAFLNL